jgi:succinate dehydrogenase/fumarate reductase cytochrome b subunit
MFHAINGMRITIQDLWPKAIKYEREAIWVEWVIFLPLYLISVLVILRTAMGV